MSMKKILAAAMTAGMMLSFIPATAMAENKGWVEVPNGDWYYYISDTEYLKETWKQIDGQWYYFLYDGTMAFNGWLLIDGKMYHFDKRGHMEKNKWIAGSEWSEELSDGNYKKGVNWYYVGSNGAAYAGWKKINGSWYYFDDFYDTGYADDLSGYCVMSHGRFYAEGGRYYFGDDGKMRTSCWVKGDYGEWYYFGADGKEVKGWKKINGKWYMFSELYGAMVTGAEIDYSNYDEYNCYMFEDDGVLTTKTGWRFDNDDHYWYYVQSGGKCCCKEWFKINGKWYYFDSLGRAIVNKTDFLIDDRLYDFDSNGACTNPYSGRKVIGFQKAYDSLNYSKRYYYGDKDGNIYRKKLLEYEGDTYYFDYDGVKVCNSNARLIDGRIYSFDADGKATDLIGDATGWVKIGKGRTYVGSDGKVESGWNQIDGKWYYIYHYDGMIQNGLLSYDINTYLLRTVGGAMITGWCDYHKKWYYADSSGRLYNNRWLCYSGSWYYFNDSCEMLADPDKVYFINGRGYVFAEDGKCLNPDKPRAEYILH